MSSGWGCRRDVQSTSRDQCGPSDPYAVPVVADDPDCWFRVIADSGGGLRISSRASALAIRFASAVRRRPVAAEDDEVSVEVSAIRGLLRCELGSLEHESDRQECRAAQRFFD